MSLAGTFDCTLKTPLGAKSGSLVVVPSPDGESFSGTLSNAMLGTVEIAHGTIDGDMLNGFAKAGTFGAMPLTGTRA